MKTSRHLARDILVLVGLIAVCLGVGLMGAVWTGAGLREWYPSLHKPAWTPPNWIFGPVWSALYAGMAIAAWRVWRKRGQFDVRPALGPFVLQPILNFFRSGLFFGLQSPGWAFTEIISLWITILATMVLFWKIDQIAGLLFLPYWLWVTFASTLNFAIWQLNR